MCLRSNLSGKQCQSTCTTRSLYWHLKAQTEPSLHPKPPLEPTASGGDATSKYHVGKYMMAAITSTMFMPIGWLERWAHAPAHVTRLCDTAHLYQLKHAMLSPICSSSTVVQKSKIELDDPADGCVSPCTLPKARHQKNDTNTTIKQRVWYDDQYTLLFI